MAARIQIRNFIGGQMLEPVSKTYFDSENPATAEIFADVPDSDSADLDHAVAAAEKAFPEWRDMGADKRCEIITKLADLIERDMAQFVEAESRDNGKPQSLCAMVDIPRAIANLRFFGEAGKQLRGEEFPSDKSFSYTLRQPFGIVSIISPWNLPLLLFTWKLAPALASGNCVIAKPSEVTPLSAFMLAGLCNEAGFPVGVVNILHGKGPKIGAAITAHAKIPAISFTGGTATGREIYTGGAKRLKKISLELGGKNPTIVFDDANFDLAVTGAKMAGFTNQGQICLCGSRILVQQSIFEKFKTAFVREVQALTLGDPEHIDTILGAMVSKPHMEKVLGYIDLAEKEGGKILTGGNRRIIPGRCANGYFIEPTVIEGLAETCRTNQEEIFGPIVTLIPFTDEAEAIHIANSTEYGLAASIWTEDKARAARVAEKIDSGIVWLNCWNMRDLRTPFGGMKNSGVGREGGLRALEFFTEEKTICRPAA